MSPNRRLLRIASLVLGIAFVTSSAVRADFVDLWANKIDVPLHKSPPRGHSKVLLIPVQIDYNGTSGNFLPIDLTQLNDFFTPTAVDAVHFTFPGYLKVASNSRYSADVTIAPLVHYVGCPPLLIDTSNASACGLPSGNIAALTKSMNFVRDIFAKSHAAGVDFSKFDINGEFATADGTIDGVMIVLNIPGVSMSFPISYVNGGSDLNGGTGGPLVLNGIKIAQVAIGGAVTFPDSSQHLETIVTHQFGSLLGLTDLNYDHPSSGDQYPNWQGLHFSSMGDWDFGAKNFLPDPESRRALAWQDQHVVSGTETLTLQPAANGGYAVKLGMMNSSRQEYYLAEVRGAVGGYDSQVTDSNGNPVWGLAVYHVDWSVGPTAAEGAFVNRLISCLDCNPWHPFIANVESSGIFGLVVNGAADLGATTHTGQGDDKVLYGTGSPTLQSIANAGILSSGNRYTATNWYDGTSSGIKINNVVVNADHTVTATFTAPAFTNPCSDVLCPPLMVCTTAGVTAGSCVASTDPVADGGPVNTGDAGPVIPTGGSSSGCSTSGRDASSTLLWLLPIALLLAAAVRRQVRA